MLETIIIELHNSLPTTFEDREIELCNFDNDEEDADFRNSFCSVNEAIEEIEIIADTEFEIYHTYDKGVIFCEGKSFKLLNFKNQNKVETESYKIELLPGYYFFHEDGETIQKIRSY